jgi:ABC-type glutathione transport system ATPase component
MPAPPSADDFAIERAGVRGVELAYDEIAFLHEGRIIESGPPDRVLSEPAQPETRRFLSRLLEAGRI